MQMKHILVALVGITTAILFIASIVLLTIGYMNPFGNVGLGILAGGCVLFFSAVLYLCACSIWIKNKYYGDETDYKEKLVARSNEDITLLKPASPTFLSAHPEAECEKNDRQGDANNPVPLYSVSTVYSSVSSSSPTIPEKLMPCNWEEEDLAGVLDSDVFSSSLTALQHGDMKSQQTLEPTKSHTEHLAGGYKGQNGQKVKDEQKRQHANTAAHNNEKHLSNLPRQRKPVVMDSPYYVPYGNGGKQVEIPLTDVQKTKETHSSTNKDLCDRNTKHCPVDTPKNTAAAPQHNDYKDISDPAKDQTQDQRNKKNAIQNIQTAYRPEFPISSSITESEPAMQNTRTNKQGIMGVMRNAGNLEKKRNFNEETDKCNQDWAAQKPSQGVSPQTKLDQSASVQISSHVTRTEASRGKVLITRKQVEPVTRTNQ